jgi:hypothetical protein
MSPPTTKLSLAERQAPPRVRMAIATWPHSACDCELCDQPIPAQERGVYVGWFDPAAEEDDAPLASQVYHLHCAARSGGDLVQLVAETDPTVLEDLAAEAEDAATAHLDAAQRMRQIAALGDRIIARYPAVAHGTVTAVFAAVGVSLDAYAKPPEELTALDIKRLTKAVDRALAD